MIYLFSTKSIKTDEEYADILRKRIHSLIILIIVGFLTAAIALANEFFGFLGENSWLDGVYTGLGSSFIVVGIIRIIQYKKCMKDEALLKAERLKLQDERNQLVATRAALGATSTVLVLSYIVMIIAGFYSRAIFYCFWWVVIIFFLSYSIFHKYYNKKL